MATFSYIQCFAISTPHCAIVPKEDKCISAYINIDKIMSFTEVHAAIEHFEVCTTDSSIVMENGTIYYFHKSLEDLVSEFGQIQYEV